VKTARTCLLVALGSIVLAACSSTTNGGPGQQQPNPSGTIRHLHFTRQGFATYCRFVTTKVIDGAAFDLYGGLPGASRQGPIATGPKAGSSCLRATFDHSVYASAEMTVNGKRQQARAVFAYFLPPGTSAVRAFPAGLHMEGTRVQFSCAHGGSPRRPAPFDCRPHFPAEPEVDAWVSFPTCWDGKGTDPSDTVYASGTQCPPGHTMLPKLQLQFTWQTPDGTGATFSTGSFKAQWTNGWTALAMASLVEHCIASPTPCGSVVNYFRRSPLP